jgi:transposase
MAARSVLAGKATSVPKTADGLCEMIRQVKVARDTARKGRTSAIITLEALVVNSPAELRENLGPLRDRALIERCAGFRPGRITDPTASAKHSLRALAKRWLDLDAEIRAHDSVLEDLTAKASPTLREGFGIGADTAAEVLIVLGDNPGRIHSEAAFAKLCGACPVPASSGMTSGRHRLYRGGHRQANAALYRTVIVRMRLHEPTIEYVARRTAEGLSKKDIIRCLKRFVAREAYQRVMIDHRARLAEDRSAEGPDQIG